MGSEIEKILAQLKDHDTRIVALEGGNIPQKKTFPTATAENSKDLALSIANKISDCQESEEIKTNILDKKGAEARVLLCFYIAYKYFEHAWLTSGDIETITAELGVKITTGNASNKIKGLRIYLESGSVRRMGAPTSYRLNRNGEKRMREILNGK